MQRWNVILPWALGMMVGMILGRLSILTLVIGLALAGASTTLVGLVGGAALGGGIGVAQWLVLRRHIPAAGRWVLVSVLGGMLGVVLGLPLSDALRPLLAAFLDEAVRVLPTGPRVQWSGAAAVGAAGAVVRLVLGSMSTDD